jgi:hypothetical protein
VFRSLKDTARAEGATVLRVETTRIIEPTGRLRVILERLGFAARRNGTMYFEGGL